MPLAFMLEMGEANSTDQLMKTISRWVPKVIPSKRCSIALLESSSDNLASGFLRFYVLSGQPAIDVGHRMPLQGSIQGRAILQGSPLMVPDLRHASGIEQPKLVEAGLRSCVCSPLISGGRCFGGLNVAHDTVGHYDQNHVMQLAAIASWIATHLRSMRQLEQLEDQSRTDFLTGALNRLAFTEISNLMFSQWCRGQTNFSVAMLDIDHFKSINDRYGHATGDAVIVNVAERIKAKVRSSDVLARIGGEEFALILTNVTCEQALKVGETIRQSIAETPVEYEDRQIHTTLSIGFAYPFEGDAEFHHILSRADQKLYLAKEMGRNRVVV